jgi:hypothetical protein
MSQKAPVTFVVPPTIYLSAHISTAPTGGISLKFDTGDFYEKLSRKSKFSLKLDRNIDTLHEGV